MWNDNSYTAFKEALETLKTNSVYHLANNDVDYQNYTKLEDMAEMEYLHLELSEEQAQIVSNLIDARDRANAEYCNLSYLAGALDCIKLLKYIKCL